MTEQNNYVEINALEKKLKIRSGFFEGLLREKDDWSFVIKLHSLIEAALTHLLVGKIKNPKIEKSITKLPLNRKKEFLTDLGLLVSYSNFLQVVTDIRNDFVHDVSNVSIKLDEYVKSNTDIKNKLSKALEQFIKELDTTIKEIPPIFRELHKKPKLLMWFLTEFLLNEIYLHLTPFKRMGLLEAALLEHRGNIENHET